MTTSKYSVQEFEAAYNAGEFVFFAGSGICCDSGLPSAVEILRRTALCALPALSSTELHSIIGHIQPEVFYEQLLAITNNSVDALVMWSTLSNKTHKKFNLTVEPNNTHLSIVETSAKHGNAIFTTNFDTLFEKAARMKGIEYSVYLPTTQSPLFSTDDRLRIVKLHGSIDIPNSLLLTMSNITRKNFFWLKALQQESYNKAICIVGYSGRDMDIFPTIKFLGTEAFPRREIIWINRFGR